MDFDALMQLALVEARKAGEEVPVGAVLVDSSGKVVDCDGRAKRESNRTNRRTTQSVCGDYATDSAGELTAKNMNKT